MRVPNEIDDILNAQYNWLKQLQDVNPAPVLIKAIAGACPNENKGMKKGILYNWVPYLEAWDMVKNPIYTRGIRLNEIMIDPDSDVWEDVRDGVRRIESYCEKEGIPVIMGFSGGKGVHCHIFFEDLKLSPAEEKKLSDTDVDRYQVARTTLLKMILRGAKVDPVKIGIDSKKYIFSCHNNGSQIRTFGTTRSTGQYKTLISEVPEEKPGPGELPLCFPDSIELWSIAGTKYERALLKALLGEAKQAERRQEYNLQGIDLSESEIVSFPCYDNLHKLNIGAGSRYYACMSIVLLAKKLGHTEEEARELLNGFLETVDITEQDAEIRKTNSLALYRGETHFSCRELKNTFGPQFCDFKNCPMKDKIQEAIDAEIEAIRVEAKAAAKEEIINAEKTNDIETDIETAKSIIKGFITLPESDMLFIIHHDIKQKFELSAKDTTIVEKFFKEQKKLLTSKLSDDEKIREEANKKQQKIDFDARENEQKKKKSNVLGSEYMVYPFAVYEAKDRKDGQAGVYKTESKMDVKGEWVETEKCITHSPVTILDSCENLDSEHEEILYTLKIVDEYGRRRTHTERKINLFSKTGLMELNRMNLGVLETQVTELQKYFDTVIYQNADIIPKAYSSERTGWKKGNSLFVAGGRGFEAAGEVSVHMLNSGIEKVYTPTGNLKDYANGIRATLKKYPSSKFMMYAAAAAPLLKLLGLPSIITMLKGSSSTGKTKICTLALSPFGSRKDDAASTKVAQELKAGQHDGMPGFYDEATNNEEKLNDIIYMLANGKGKDRGTQHGAGIIEGKEWSTVVLYNGENSLIKESDNVGKLVRVIEISHPIPKSPKNKEMLNDLEKCCKKNNGLLTPLIMKEIFKNFDVLQQRHKEFEARLQATNAAGDRLKSHFAAFAVAGQILENVFSEIKIENDDPFEIVNEVFEETVVSKPIKNEYERALSHIWNWVAANRGFHFMDLRTITNDDEAPDIKGEAYGWITAQAPKEKPAGYRICFVPSKLKKELNDNGYSAEKVIEDWAEHGFLDCQVQKGKNGLKVGSYRTASSKTINLGEGGNEKVTVIRMASFPVLKYFEHEGEDVKEIGDDEEMQSLETNYKNDLDEFLESNYPTMRGDYKKVAQEFFSLSKSAELNYFHEIGADKIREDVKASFKEEPQSESDVHYDHGEDLNLSAMIEKEMH